MKTIYSLAILPFLLVAVSPARSANILWNAPAAITGDSDINTTGTLFYAANLGVNTTTAANFAFGPAASPTISGQLFEGVNINTMTPSSSLPLSPIAQFSPISANSGAVGLTVQATTRSTFGGGTGFNSLSLEYRDMLGSGAYSSATTLLTFSSLTTGDTYLFQWWSNDSRALATAESRTPVGASAGNLVELDYNTSPSGSNGLGQYAIGTFVADGPTQTIEFIPGGGGSLINGFQLRTVPEPGSAMLAGLALLGTLSRRRRTR